MANQKTTRLNEDEEVSRPIVTFICVGLMWVLCLGSALMVVHTTFESRKAMQKLEALRSEAGQLQVLSGQYLLEKSSESSYAKVVRIATEELNMKNPEPEKTVLVYRE